MSEETPWYEQVVIPGLLRHARAAYGQAMRRALEAAGHDDIPGNGLYILGGLNLSAGQVPLGQLVRELRVSKQAAGQLVDALVARGYLERRSDPEDRRKLTVALTERGRTAARIQAEARNGVDAALLGAIGAEGVSALRRGLGALCEMAREGRGEAD